MSGLISISHVRAVAMTYEATLHYLYDPLCGWCYAAEPLIFAVLDAGGDRIEVELHGGGLVPTPQSLPAEKRELIRCALHRVTQLTGRPFSRRYIDCMLRNPATLWDSMPAIGAVLVASRSDRGLAYLEALHQRLYRNGDDIMQTAVLVSIAVETGFDAESFATALAALPRAEIEVHAAASQDLLARVGGVGFPSYVLEHHGRLELLALTDYYGHPEDFVDYVAAKLGWSATKP